MRFLKNTFNFTRSCAFAQIAKFYALKMLRKQNLTHPKAAKLATLRKSKYGLNPTLSQGDPEGQTHSGVEDDDLHLCLSQSQQVETQQSLDDTVVSDVSVPQYM